MSNFWDPMYCTPPGSSVHGILQARTLEWVAISCSILFLWVCLFWMFPINGIIQYVTVCAWLLSLSIMNLRAILLGHVCDKESVIYICSMFPGGSDGRVSCNAQDEGSIPGKGRSPGEENGNPLQCSCLENPMDAGARQGTVHGVAKSQIWLSDFTFTFICMFQSQGAHPCWALCLGCFFLICTHAWPSRFISHLLRGYFTSGIGDKLRGQRRPSWEDLEKIGLGRK